MYVSNYEITKEISDYQLELLCYLEGSYEIVTNEGAGFRAWLEKDGKGVPGVVIRKDSCEKLLVWGLIVDISITRDRKFRYGLTEKGVKCIVSIDDSRMAGLRRRVASRLG